MAATIAEPKAPAIRQNPGLTPSMLHHAAWVTHDAAATTDFYTRIMGMELVCAVVDDSVPSTGDEFPFLHIFFKMKDGSTFAFFEMPGLPSAARVTHRAYDILNHIALEVSSTEEVHKWHDWLKLNGIEVVGPTHHEMVLSVYFYDPNGLRLEITTPLDKDWNNHADDAKKVLAGWVRAKEKAKREGCDTVQAMKAFAREAARAH